jgi:ribosome-binding factor A
MTTYRQQRISDLLHQELSLLIGAELSDPRLEDALVTVTKVAVSADLHNARVSIEHALPRESSRQVLAALKHAEGFLRRAIAENLNLRVVPELSFHVDETERRVRHIDELLDSLAAQAQPVASTPENDVHEHAG